MIANLTIQIIADNTDVFGGTWAEEPPAWAKNARVQAGFSDYDALIDFSIGSGLELMVNSAPHVFGADNLAQPDWNRPHVSFPVSRGSDFKLDMNFNVVTGGVGWVVIQFEG